ncbi:HEAT repeat domain-containing protein [Alienimonas californiensis]|uniref:HEAT repeat domain-containing protein n=1 Tax=Alienimonas californiensis TaxID=2527989 RepID=A0A517P8I3_9PLAN|nr:HEAT repeat domain-containing protein [Alienimonas californiensis]QDT15680.1 hypothetical protein CA12_17700 [Alienimonas californiensis]
MNALVPFAVLAVACLQEPTTAEPSPADLIAAATTPERPESVFPALPSLSTALRRQIAGELQREPIRAAFARLDARGGRNVDWFAAVEALETEKAVWCLQAAVVHPHEDVQIRALRALGRMGDADAVPFLLTYGEYVAVEEPGSENATLHGVVHETLAETLSNLTGVFAGILDGQDPEGLKRGLREWSRWLVVRQAIENGDRLLDRPPGPTDVTSSDLELKIALDQPVYRPLEPILVTSSLTNRSRRQIVVKEPRERPMVVTLHLYRIAEPEDGPEPDGGGLVPVLSPGWGGGRTGEIAPETMLAPGEAVARSTNVLFSHAGPLLDLEPGEYLLEARYHLASDWWEAFWEENVHNPVKSSAGYQTFVVEATARFAVRPPTAAERPERAAFDAAEKALNPPRTVLDLPDPAPLERFLDQYPQSIYRVAAFDALADYWWDRKDFGRMADVYAALQKEKVGEETREKLVWLEESHRAQALKEPEPDESPASP